MAKRVNTRFLIILTAVFAVLFAAVVVVQFVGVFRKDPAAQARAGDQLLAEGKAREALDKYRYAVARNPNDKGLLIKIGDAYNQMVMDDPTSLGNARVVWNQVVALDPNYEPALDRLLESYWQQMESAPMEGELYHRIRETAQRLADVRKAAKGAADTGVEAKVHIVTLRPWLDGYKQVFTTADVTKARTELEQLAKRDPANADIPYYVALAKLKTAQDLRLTRLPKDEADADALINQAGAVMDKALAGQEANAAMQLRAYQVYTVLEGLARARAAIARSKAIRDNQPPPATQSAEAEAFAAKAKSALDAAMEAAKALKVEDPLYADIFIAAARAAQADRRTEDAEKIYENLVKGLPDDLNVRIHYAALLAQSGATAKRDKAIELLSTEVDVSRLKGARGFVAAQLRVKALIDLVDARLEKARTLQADEKQRAAAQEIVTRAKSELEKLSGMLSSDAVPVLRLRGRIQQLEGNPIGSIQTFQRAVSLMQGSSNKDFNLVNELANSYLFAGQTGEAKKLLQDVIDRYGDVYVPARLQMAQVLIAENKIEDAKLQLNAAQRTLDTLQGNTDIKEFSRWQADFQRITLALLARTKDPRLDEKYAKMPEGTRAERLGKAQIAIALKKPDEATRLGALVLAEDPADLTAVDLVVNAHLVKGAKTEALAVVDKALAANPADLPAQKLKVAREKILAQIELANATPDQVYARNKQIIESEPESANRPGEKAVKLATLELRHAATKQGDDAKRLREQAEAILVKALESDPRNVPVLTKLFETSIAFQQWEKAKGWCDRLVATKADGAEGLLYQFRLAMARPDGKADALRIGKAVRDTRSEFDLGYVAYGQALQALERYAEAVEEYRKARTKKPLNFDALKGMVECYYALNQPRDARALIDEARGLFPENPQFRDLELAHELAFGDPETVAQEREAIHKQQPENRESWLELAAAYRTVARTKYDRDAAKKTEILTRARDLLKQALERWKDDAEFTANLAAVLYEMGDAAGGEKLLADYARAPHRMAECEPLLVLADYYVRARELEKAEAVSREALKRAEAARDAAQKQVESGAGGDAAALAAARTTLATQTRIAVNIRLRLAEFLAMYGRFDDALAALDGAAPGSGPTSAEMAKQLFRQRLQVLISSDRRDLAERQLLEALARPATANDPDLQMTLVAVNFEARKYDEALARVNQVLKADPDNVKVRFFRGQILLRKPKPDLDAAINDLVEVRKRDPGSVGARRLLADAYRKRGDMPTAVRELEEGVRLQPTARDLRLQLIDFHSSLTDWDEVLRLAKEARNHLQLKDDPVWPYREAGVYVRRRDWTAAFSAIEEAIRLDPRDHTLRREQQNILLLAGKNQEVLALTDAMAKDPTKAPWWVFSNRGRARHALGDQAGAVNEFNTGLTAAGQNNAAVESIVKEMVTTVGKEQALQQVMARAQTEPRWKLLAAALYSVNKDWDNAVRMLDEVQAHFPQLSDAHKAQALRIAGPMYQMARPPQFDKAKSTYEQLLKMYPDDLFALNNLANLLVDDALVPQPQEARKHSQRAYDLVKRAQPLPAAIFDTHGWVLVQCGEVTEAIDILQKVVSTTRMPEAYYHLGEAYLRKQDTAKAGEALRAADEAISAAVQDGGTVTPDLDKKIKAALQKVNDMERAARGGEAATR